MWPARGIVCARCKTVLQHCFGRISCSTAISCIRARRCPPSIDESASLEEASSCCTGCPLSSLTAISVSSTSCISANSPLVTSSAWRLSPLSTSTSGSPPFCLLSIHFCLLVNLALSLLMPKISSSKSYPIARSSLRFSLLCISPTVVDSGLSSPPSTPHSIVEAACTPDSNCLLCWATSSALCFSACAHIVTTYASSFSPRIFSKMPLPSSSPTSAPKQHGNWQSVWYGCLNLNLSAISFHLHLCEGV